MIITRFIAGHLLRSWLIVFTVLAALFGLLALVGELDNLDQRYRFVHALQYVLMTTPQRVLELAPVITALGTVLALANLSRSSELVVLRSAGISRQQLLAMAALPTLLVVTGLYVAGEWLVAPMLQKAQAERTVRRSGNLDLVAGRGLWSRSGGRFLNVRKLRDGHIPEGIALYEFAPDHRLTRVIVAASAEVQQNREWTLRDVRLKEWSDAGRIGMRSLEQLDMGPFWSAEELPALGRSLTAMPPSALLAYADHLHATGQDDVQVRMAFWQKATLPLSAAAMVLLSVVLGCGFGNARSAGFGWRVLGAAVAGVGFYLLTQILHTGGQLLGLQQNVVALVPICIAIGLAFAIATITRRPH